MPYITPSVKMYRSTGVHLGGDEEGCVQAVCADLKCELDYKMNEVAGDNI